ncbi:MAG: ribbon-helix-helix protein, CopG family [Acidobacteria bacterium]|nr:ribbon-helix-helix protein, CopG family [Acidobacteriota bacterium]
MAVGRPKKDRSEMLVEVPCKVPSATADVIEKLAIGTDRSRSQIARKLIARGLAAYRRDGLLDEPEESATSLRPDPATAELLSQFGKLPIVMAESLVEDEVRPVASAKPRKG